MRYARLLADSVFCMITTLRGWQAGVQVNCM
jgi:hypothetical protein